MNRTTLWCEVGRASAGSLTFPCVGIDERCNPNCIFTGVGRFTDDPLDTFGHEEAAHIPNFQSFVKYIRKNRFEHPIAMTVGHGEGFRCPIAFEIHAFE